ncbi:hypothetical protein AHAS_Ahas12G0095200 [Arachis hypogaea]
MSDLGDGNMAAPQKVTLMEVGAPDITLQPLQVRYPDLDANFELKIELINFLPKHHRLPGENPVKHLKDFQVVCSTTRRHGSDEIDTDRLRKVISCIMQRDGEILYEYWECFKKLLESYPHHCIEDLVLISYFCQGLVSQDKLLIDASSGGSLTKHKTTEEAWEVITDLADSTQYLSARNP